MVTEVSKEPVELVLGSDTTHLYIKDVIETALTVTARPFAICCLIWICQVSLVMK